MKKPILLGLAFISIDQAVKLLILNLAFDVRQTLIPGVLTFHPVRNTNLNWVSSMAGITPPVWLLVVLQLLLLVMVVLLYRYLSFYSKGGGLLSLFFSFAAAGIACSFIDVAFWGGSLDFLGLFDWFVFDTKDLFLNASYIVLGFWEIRRQRSGGQAEEAGAGRGAMRAWLRQGCPMIPRKSADAGRN